MLVVSWDSPPILLRPLQISTHLAKTLRASTAITVILCKVIFAMVCGKSSNLGCHRRHSNHSASGQSNQFRPPPNHMAPSPRTKGRQSLPSNVSTRQSRSSSNTHSGRIIHFRNSNPMELETGTDLCDHFFYAP